MPIINVHRRRLRASRESIGPLLDRLASRDDRLWPHDRWPAMRFDRPLGVGARGGHGPIRYTVEQFDPGRHVRFRFTGPRGFDGYHEIHLDDDPSGCCLVHELRMTVHGWARLSWPFVYRPLHDALVEDALDRAATVAGDPGVARWSWRVRVLRRLLALLLPRATTRGA